MAIGNSCYIREIPEDELKMLKLLSKRLHQKTATGIFLKLPQLYFDQEQLIANKLEKIRELEGQLQTMGNELKTLKRSVHDFFTVEKELHRIKEDLIAKI